MSKNICKVLTDKYFLPEMTFLVEEGVVGNFVSFPFRNKQSFGLITSLEEFSPYELKEAVLLKFSLQEGYRKFLFQMAFENLFSPTYFVKYLSKLISKRSFPLLTISESFQTFELNEEQNQVKEEVLSHSAQTYLLWGVTGSGKTEVFFKIAEEVLKKKQQVLIILPEIAITESILRRFSKQFGVHCALWNSTVKNKSTFQRICNGNISVIIGSRSSLLLPFANLGLIVIDEEHDKSYKQNVPPIYHCREMAVLRGKIENIPVILASATPSCESFFCVQQKQYKLLRLTKRYGNRVLPKVTPVAPLGLIAPYILTRTAEELSKNGQVLYFLNRRGFANYISCHTCHKRSLCPKCSAGLVLHRLKDCLLCHKCHSSFGKEACFFCKGGPLLCYGSGVEKIAEFLQLHFPDSCVEVLSSDTCDNVQKISAFLHRIHKKEIQIIVGTQMVAKGHDFPDLSLVVVLNMETSFFDFRLAETTFQNLVQVAGRAGRGNMSSEVLIQTAKKDSFFCQALMKHDYESFLREEMIQRQRAQLPPFTRLINFRLPNTPANQKKMLLLKNSLKQPLKIYESLSLFINLLVKISLQEFLEFLKQVNPVVQKLQIVADVDPQDFS